VGASQGGAPQARGLPPGPLSAPLIVLDTGVVVRALTGRPDSASSEVVRAAQTGEVRLAVSDAFLAETIRVLREPRVEARIVSAGRAFGVTLGLGFMGRHYRPRRHDWPSVPDPNDYWMPDLALASGADLVPLPLEVVTPAELLQTPRGDGPKDQRG